VNAEFARNTENPSDFPSAIFEVSAFFFVDQYSIISSSGKQYSQRSPGSADATTG